MKVGRQYRLVSITVALCAIFLAVLVANHPIAQRAITVLPVLSQLPPTVLSGNALWIAVATVGVVLLIALAPLFKPRPRPTLNTIFLTERQVVLGCVALAALGYFDYTYRLPRTTLVVLGVLLLASLPVIFIAVNRSWKTGRKAVIIGTDTEQMKTALDAAEMPVVGYISPSTRQNTDERTAKMAALLAPDDVTENTDFDRLRCLGSLSQLPEILTEYDIGLAVLAFPEPDREGFFAALATCYEHGLSATVHRAYSNAVLTTETGGKFVEVDLKPWDWQDYAAKFVFDKAFALVGFMIFAPVMVVIAVAIKLDSRGPLLYHQERTTEFGGTFQLYKFRTMIPDSESTIPATDETNAHITRVGHFLRRTHLDELPQLYSILAGDMSVVGPRATWVKEERGFIEARSEQWRKRWFVKPGLTGLAQINNASSTNPELKLRYDVEYIRQQSLIFDIKIVIRQVWDVLRDMASTLS
jgi:lipopolysaccharide/colanic/teichoic acid biosynthesis glycosyltransferase